MDTNVKRKKKEAPGIDIGQETRLELYRMQVDLRYCEKRAYDLFLQNLVTDLLLGVGFHEGFRFFADHVTRRYGAQPGFITMNLPRLLDALEAVGIVDPIICANINSLGFRMCGGRELYETTIATRKFQPIAMSVLASGAIPPRDAIEYVCRQKNIRSIVFGASSKPHILQTKRLIEELSAAAE